MAEVIDKTAAVEVRESAGPPLPVTERFVLIILKQYGMPTLFALAIGAAFFYWSDRTARERKEDRIALQGALQTLASRVDASQEALGRVELILLMQSKQGQESRSSDPAELVKRRDNVARLQKQVPVLAPAPLPLIMDLQKK